MRALLDDRAPARPRRRRLAAPAVLVACAAVALIVVVTARPLVPAAPDRAGPGCRRADERPDRGRRDPAENHSGRRGRLGGARSLNLQQAGSTADPAYYPKAHGTLARSLQLRPDANPDGLGGLAALRLAQHCFAESRELAERALAPQRFALWGTLADADPARPLRRSGRRRPAHAGPGRGRPGPHPCRVWLRAARRGPHDQPVLQPCRRRSPG